MVKTFTMLAMLLLVAGCSATKYNSVAFGKKCVATQTGDQLQVAHAYVWFYNKDTGLHANKEDCKALNSN